MTVYIMTPDSSVSENHLLEVAGTLIESPDNAWQGLVRGGNANDVARDQAQIAVELGNAALRRQSNRLGEWLNQTSDRRITFRDTLGQAGATEVGVGFAAYNALIQVEAFINAEMLPLMVEWQPDASLEHPSSQGAQEIARTAADSDAGAHQGTPGDAGNAADDSLVVYRIVRRSDPIKFDWTLIVCGNLQDGDQHVRSSSMEQWFLESIISSAETLGGSCRILRPASSAMPSESLREFAESRQAKLIDVDTLDDVFKLLLSGVSNEVYEQGVVRICKTVDSLLAQYEVLEANNEEFMDDYTVQVIRPGARLVCLENRRHFYEAQLKEMEAARRLDQQVTPICDELRSILGRPGTDFGEEDVTPDTPLGEHDVEDEGENDELAAEGRGPRRNDYDDSLILTDAKRRFKSAALGLEHPDSGGDGTRFNAILRRAEEDPLLMQAYVLRYWPRFVERNLSKDKIDSAPDASRDDMSDFDTVSDFLHEAREILDQLAERFRRRLTDRITVERILYEKSERDSIKQEHEQIIAATRQVGREIRRLLKDIRGLCAEAKR